MKNILLSFMLATLCGCGTPKTASPNHNSGMANAPAKPTVETMRTLAKRISAGDKTAFDELAATAKNLYRDINRAQEEPRVISDLVLMRAAFDELGERADQGDTKAFAALKLSLGTEYLKSFAPDALGIAAAAANEEALTMLLNYQQWGILESTAVFSLRRPAEGNNEKAVHFLAGVMANPNARPLWFGASEGLVGAAVRGNTEAKAALKNYKADN